MKRVAIAINLDWPLDRYHEVYRGIQSYAAQTGEWKIIWDHFPERALRKHSEPYYDGIIGRIELETYNEAVKLNIPIVNTWYSNTLQKLPSVYVDFTSTGKMAVEHLWSRGVRHFVLIDHEGSRAAKDYLKGFKSFLSDKVYTLKSYEISPDLTDYPELWAKFCTDFSAWIGDWKFPTGISFGLSSEGPKIITRVMENSLKIPKDILIISPENDPSYCEILSPHITAINQNYFKIGFESARMLDLQLKGIKLEELHQYIPPVNITPRESTDFYPIHNITLTEAIRYIANNFTRPILSSDVVKNLKVSRRTLDMLFLKHLGHTVTFEINRCRISLAKRLLKESDYKLKELVVKVGFKNKAQLIKYFIKYENMSPEEWQQQYSSHK